MYDRPALIVFLTAAIARIAIAASLWDLPIVRTPKLDSAEYLAWARRLAAGDWAWPVVAQHGPGYPVFLAGLLAASSGSIKAAMVLQALMGACTAVMLTAVARRIAGPRAGLFAGLAYALYGPAVYIDTAIASEGLLLFLLTAALLALTAEPLTLGAAAAGGALFGAAALVRPTALVIAAAVVLSLLVARRSLLVARRSLLAGACAAAALAVMTPALAKNWTTAGSLSVQGYGGLNAYIGNSPLHDGRATFRLGAGWDALNAEAARAGIADATAQDRYYVAKTWREVTNAPGAFLRLLALKGLWLLQADEARDSHSYYFFTDQSVLLRILPRWLLLFPLACLGALMLARDRLGASRAGLLAWYAAGVAASVVLLVVGFRYRMPLVPVMAVAAGVGVDRFASWRADWRVYATLAAAVVASLLLSDPRHRNLAEEWALTGSALITEHNLADAEAAYRRALAIDAGSGLAWDGLGLALYDGGRLTDARAAFERALAIDADNARAVYHVALVDDREGRTKVAALGYARALSLSPFDGEVTRSLVDARRRLATESGMSGRTSEARDLMRGVVALRPDDGDAWLDIALLSLDLGDKGAAREALDRARAAGANPDKLAFAATALAR